MTVHSREIRLLLVDDEVDFLQAMERGLVRRGFAVETADNGQAALDLLSSGAFDVVVLDVKMPGMDGIDTFREIKRVAPDLPVILLTGHGNIEQAFETSRDGVFDYLTKPCDVEELAAVARQAVEDLRENRNGTVPAEGIRVLLVDDDRDFLESVRPALERRGVIVATAHNAKEGMRCASERQFDVAVVDVRMPDVDGLTLLKQLHSNDPRLEVIILTGHPSVSDVRHGLKDGAFDYLVKPVPVDELVGRVRDAYNRREQHLERDRQEEVDRTASQRPD